MISDADALLEINEGYSEKLYKDSEGFWSIGRGYCIEKLGLPRDIIDMLYARRRDAAIRAIEGIFGFTYDKTNPRHAAVLDMAYELGETGLRAFVHLRACWEAEEWDGAADAVADSLYARQVPHRAARTEALIRTGDWASLKGLL